MNEAERGRTEPERSVRRASPADRFCAAVDRTNELVGRVWGLSVVLVTAAVIFEVVSRSAFGQGTLWANETTIYLSAMTYLIAGGYALLHRRHVQIDLVYLLFPRHAQLRLDAVAFIFFLAYAATLIWVGGGAAWTSFEQREGTGTPWNPAIWPVKAIIPVAGLLLLLQGIANLLRDFGLAAKDAKAGR